MAYHRMAWFGLETQCDEVREVRVGWVFDGQFITEEQGYVLMKLAGATDGVSLNNPLILSL